MQIPGAELVLTDMVRRDEYVSVRRSYLVYCSKGLVVCGEGL
jgi:hypothetical protein